MALPDKPACYEKACIIEPPHLIELLYKETQINLINKRLILQHNISRLQQKTFIIEQSINKQYKFPFE